MIINPRLAQGINRGGNIFTIKGILNPGINESARRELAKVATILTNPAWPRTIRAEAIRRRWGLPVINSDSLVVNPVPVKHDKDWNLENDQSSPVNWKAIAPIRTTIREIIITMMNKTKFMGSSYCIITIIL